MRFSLAHEISKAFDAAGYGTRYGGVGCNNGLHTHPDPLSQIRILFHGPELVDDAGEPLLPADKWASAEDRAAMEQLALDTVADEVALEAAWQLAQALKITSDNAPKLIDLLIEKQYLTEEEVVQALTS